MTTSRTSAARSWLPLAIAVCLVAVNSRITISGIGPLLDEIARDEALTATTAGLLAAIPAITWAVLSPFTQSLAERFGIDAVIAWALAGLTVATIWRSLPGSPINLWLGTALTGAALAITNVIMPAAIKRDFGRRVPLMLAVYSAVLGIAAAVGAGIVAPIAHIELGDGAHVGWRWALLATGATLPIALAVWLLVARHSKSRKRGEDPGLAVTPKGLGRRVWGDPVAWLIAMFLGMQSANYYTLSTWISPLQLSRGVDLITAGTSVTVFLIFNVVGSFISPLISRGGLRRFMPVGPPLIGALSALCLLWMPALSPLWLSICGFTTGTSLGVLLLYITERAATAHVAGALSGMSQSVGYVIGGLGPILFGWLYGFSGGWELPFVLLVVGAVVQGAMGVALWRERLALPETR